MGKKEKIIIMMIKKKQKTHASLRRLRRYIPRNLECCVNEECLRNVQISVVAESLAWVGNRLLTGRLVKVHAA